MIFIWVVREQFTSIKLHLLMRATIVRALFYEKITLRMQSADTQSRLDRLWNAYMCSMWYVIFFILMIQHWERCILKWTFVKIALPGFLFCSRCALNRLDTAYRSCLWAVTIETCFGTGGNWSVLLKRTCYLLACSFYCAQRLTVVTTTNDDVWQRILVNTCQLHNTKWWRVWMLSIKIKWKPSDWLVDFHESCLFVQSEMLSHVQPLAASMGNVYGITRDSFDKIRTRVSLST